LDLDQLLRNAVQLGASDVHIKVGSPPFLRIDGRLDRTDLPAVSPVETERIAFAIMPKQRAEEFIGTSEADFAYSVSGLGRFRVNVMRQRGSVGLVLRRVQSDIPSFEELGLPPVIRKLTDHPRGLVLVTGPTGSGKTTTLGSMIDFINDNYNRHIVTIEDPIEILHADKCSIVNQREVGTDTADFHSALKRVLRQDPDVILVGEVRDVETVKTALTAAETGHLVFGTLHTQSAPSTIDRIIDVFPAEQQEQVRIQIANSLQGVVTQALLPTADGMGRVPALEILLPDDAVRNLIRQGKVEQIYSVMQTNTGRGMQTMEQSLGDLIMRRVVDLEVGLSRSSRQNQLIGLLERSGFAVDLPPDLDDSLAQPQQGQSLGAGLRVAGS
jgi:twitching motility protein PilT